MMHANIEKKELTTTGAKPQAVNLRDLLTRAQVAEIKLLSDDLGVTHSYISKKLFDLPYDFLSIAGADDVLTILREMKSLTETVHKVGPTIIL